VAEDGAEDDKVLNYATPSPSRRPLGGREYVEYYRKRPHLDPLNWVLAFILFLIVLVILGCLGVFKVPIG
jgi:hypothetical protein